MWFISWQVWWWSQFFSPSWAHGQAEIHIIQDSLVVSCYCGWNASCTSANRNDWHTCTVCWSAEEVCQTAEVQRDSTAISLTSVEKFAVLHLLTHLLSFPCYHSQWLQIKINFKSDSQRSDFCAGSGMGVTGWSSVEKTRIVSFVNFF